MTRWIVAVLVVVVLGCGERGDGGGPTVDAGPGGDAADPCAGCAVACDGIALCERADGTFCDQCLPDCDGDFVTSEVPTCGASGAPVCTGTGSPTCVSPP